MLVYLLLLLLLRRRALLCLFFVKPFFPHKNFKKRENAAERNDDAWRFFVSSCVVGSADARAEKTDWSE